MRVAILLNARFPTEKAYGIQVLAMARGFAQAGVEVAVVYPQRSSDVPDPIQGVTFVPFGWKIGLRWPWMFHAVRIVGVLQAKAALRAWNPDIVLVNDPVQAAYLASQFAVVWDLHDVPNPDSALRRWLIRRIARSARAIVSTNQLKLDLLKKLVGSLPPTTVLPNPVSFDISTYRSITREAARAKVGIGEQEKAVVYAGQLYDWKGVDTLIAAAAFMPKDVVVHIVGGKGEDLERCTKIASGLPPHAAKVLFHGLQPAESIPAWLRAAYLVVVPNSGKFAVSVRDTNPLKLYEALAAEAAILASNLPSIREAVGESTAVVFVKADDARAWGACLGELLSDPSRVGRMRQAADSFHGLLASSDRAMRLIDFFSSVYH